MALHSTYLWIIPFKTHTMKQILLVIAGIILSLIATAREPLQIQGKLAGNGQPVAAATILLSKATDSSLLKTAISGEGGEFSIAAPGTGEYFITITAVGYADYHSGTINIETGAAHNMGTIELERVNIELDAVTIVKKKPLIETKIDRMVMNVEGTVTATGSTVLEVLEKAPGVQVDKDGNISLKGKQGIMVMIDGRPSYVSGEELANLLRAMNAEQVSQIEIMTNPPAKFDASGNSGVINIITKKNKSEGMNGTVSASGSQGVYPSANAGLVVNYKNKKFNLFSNYSYTKRNRFNTMDLKRDYYNEDGSLRAIFDQVVFNGGRVNVHNLKAGADYYLNSNTIVGLVASGSRFSEYSRGDNLSYLKNPLGVTDSLVASNYKGNTKWNNTNLNLNFRKKLDSNGRELTMDIDYINYTRNGTTIYQNTILDASEVEKYDEWLKANLPFTINIYSARLDYTYPVNDKIKLETGLKSGIVNAKTKANYYEIVQNDWETDYKRTNFFDYDENIQAAYVNYKHQLTEKLGIQAGLRYEHTSYAGHQFGNPHTSDSSFKKSYGSLFPTLYISYQASETHLFSINTGRRITRPRYQNMNPFMFFIDKYTMGQGNPYLKPEFSQNFELSHVYKGKYVTTLNYGVTNDLFAETFDQPEDSTGYSYVSISRNGNIGLSKNAGISFSAQVAMGKWNNASIYTSYNYQHFKGLVNGDPLNVGGGTFAININNQIRLGQKWSAEASGRYNTKGIIGQIIIMPRGSADLGISRKILQGNGNLKLVVRDVFFTNQAKADLDFKSTFAVIKNRWDSQTVTLSFNYRFGKAKNGGQTRRNELEELKRLN